MKWVDERIKEFSDKLDNISSQIDSLKESYESLREYCEFKKEPVVHLGANARFITYSHTAGTTTSLLTYIKNYELEIGDKITLVELKKYNNPTFVIVNIDSDGKYYLMPTTNLDVLPLHPSNCNWKCTCFEDSYMLKDTLGDFEEYFSSMTHTDLEHFEATLASKEEIFYEDKAFPYFKALFKEGRETYIREFGKDSYFWLRSVVPSSAIALANNDGSCTCGSASLSHGFRPLIILD